MRRIVLLMLVLFPMLSLAQKEITLKKKYFGKYAGVIPAYKMDSGAEILEVSSTVIYVMLTEDQIAVTIGNSKLSGTYIVMFEAQTYFLIDATMEGQLATERILVYKRGKRISRDGMYPQPVTELEKVKY
jgi:hypothetical protein